MPTLVQGALQARLDRLPPRTREVVSVAARDRAQASACRCSSACCRASRSCPALSELMRLDLIVEVRRRPGPEYRFRHGLVQEVAYASLLEADRRRLHRRIGEALEALFGEPGERSTARSRATSPRPTSPSGRRATCSGRRRRARRLRRPRGGRALPAARARSCAGSATTERERETLFKIALVRHLAFDYAQRRAGLRRGVRALLRPAAAAERATERLEIALMRPDSFAPGHVERRRGERDHRAALPRAAAVDHDLNVVPELAQNMSVSADGLTYLFMLREDACWSDGHPLTAGDFVVRLAASCARRGTSRRSCSTTSPRRTALDDWTLEMRLREPRNYFPYVLARTGRTRGHATVEKMGADWRHQQPLVSNGPFMLAEMGERQHDAGREPALGGRLGNVGEVHVGFRVQRPGARAVAVGSGQTSLAGPY